MKSRKQRNDIRKTFRKFGKRGKKNKTNAKRHMMSNKKSKKSKKGEDPSKSRQVGGNPTELIDAIQQDNTELIPGLIEGGADINTKDKYGRTPLLLATQYNNTEIVQLLIEKGADVNAKNKYGWTPLLWATVNNNTKLSVLLVEKGADVNAKDNDGRTPLYWATSNNNEEIINAIEDKKRKDENWKRVGPFVKAVTAKDENNNPVPVTTNSESVDDVLNNQDLLRQIASYIPRDK